MAAAVTQQFETKRAGRCDIRAITPRFEPGQDERPEVFAEITASLDDPTLGAWMRRFEPAAA